MKQFLVLTTVITLSQTLAFADNEVNNKTTCVVSVGQKSNLRLYSVVYQSRLGQSDNNGASNIIVIDDVKIYNGEEEIGSFSKEDAQGVPSQVLGPKAVSAI